MDLNVPILVKYGYFRYIIFGTGFCDEMVLKIC